MILAHRWFSAAVVVTLALGIGLNTMVFTLVDAVLLKPVAIPGGERLVAISDSDLSHVGDYRLDLSLPDLRDYRAQASSLESIEGATDEAFSQPGDSGSLVVDEESRAIGLIFGGGGNGGKNGKGLSYANPIRTALNELKVDLVIS